MFYEKKLLTTKRMFYEKNYLLLGLVFLLDLYSGKESICCLSCLELLEFP